MNQPKLIILIGLPGCGKSTYAHTLKLINDNITILSSDALRKELFGDENIQTQNDIVFKEMQKRTIDSLTQGKDVIYDATNISRKSRASIISVCPKFARIEAHVVWAPIELCIERDSQRSRSVGKHVIDRMVKNFQAPYFDEGIHDITIFVPPMFNRYENQEKMDLDMNIPHDNPHHTYNILKHCEAATLYANDKGWHPDLQFALAYHDCGKPYTKAFINGKGEPTEIAHYYQHQCVGAWISYGMFCDPFIPWLISTHMDPYLNTHYYNALPEYLKQNINKIYEADLAAH